MSLPTVVWSTIQARGRAFFRTAFPGKPMGLKQFFGQLTRAVAINIWSGQKTLEALSQDIVPQPQSSSLALSMWAWLLGLPDGDGDYGRLKPTLAAGGAASLTGEQGTSFPDGATATAEDGTTQIELSGTVAIAGSSGLGSVDGVFVAVTLGTVGNLPIGTVMTWDSPPSGADPTFTLTSALAGAIDEETNAAVYQRIVQRLQFPPQGGNATDYERWAQLAAAITGIYVYPRRDGTGTVDIVITTAGHGTARVPSEALRVLAQAFIDENRPAAADASTVYVPQVYDGHVVRVRVEPTNANPFDWGADAPGTAYTVAASGYTAGPPAKIKLTALAPDSLTAAVAAYIAGTATAPRIQVLSTDGAAVNPPIRVVSIATVAGPVSELTLETLPTAWTAPSDGDTIYPYGTLVGVIAPLLETYIDGLGPSRESGFANEFDEWDDTIRVNQLSRVAEDAVDATGAPYVIEVIDEGAMIDGAETNVQASDDSPGAPEMLWAKHIAVTQ